MTKLNDGELRIENKGDDVGLTPAEIERALAVGKRIMDKDVLGAVFIFEMYGKQLDPSKQQITGMGFVNDVPTQSVLMTILRTLALTEEEVDEVIERYKSEKI